MKAKLPLLSALLLTLFSGSGFAKDANSLGPISLEQTFASPPTAAKPFVHWYWHIPPTQEKITQDLEAMQAEGIQGARVYPFDVYMKPEWPPLFAHLLKDAGRLGLQIHLNNDCAWSCKKLPWMTPEFAQKRIIHTATSVTGGGAVHATLPRPEINDPVFANYAKKFTPRGQEAPVNQYYTDVAALAVRKIAGAKPLPKQRAETGLLWSIQPFDLMTARDNYPSFPPEAPDVFDDPQWLETGVPAPGPEDVVNLSSQLKPDGTIDWDAPPGEWTILRFGCTLLNPWAPDFFRKDALDYHLQESVEKLLPGAGSQVGRTWTHMQFDSWENGRQTWTPDFPDEFRKRRGYDLTPWLPVLAGLPIGSASLSSRFLHDYRRTISDLLVENHFAHWTKRLHEMGLQFTTQGAYGWASPIADGLRVFGAVDQPQGEIWNPQRHPLTGKLQVRQFQIHKIDRESPLAPRALPFGLGLNTIRLAASAAHIYGKPACSAETFSSYYDTAGDHSYTETPETPAAYLLADPPCSLKTTADRAFSDGLQHVAYHVYSPQPADREASLHVLKGYGLNFNRNMTWWKQSHAFTEYLARCSALLQRGTFVADFAYWTGDAVPYGCPDRRAMRPALPLGCNADLVNTDVLLNHLAVKQGRLLLPSGLSYGYLVMPPTQSQVDSSSLRRIRDLVVAGATVLLGRKPVSTTGLSDNPRCDEEVRQIADELWGSGEKPAAGIRSVGRGRVACGMAPAEILKADSLHEDVQISGPDGQSSFDWIHRRDGETDLYFVSNQSDETKKVNITFRVSGAKPEWWDSVNGTRRALPEFSEKNGVTTVPLEFLPRQSAFVVFSRDFQSEDLFKGNNFADLQTAETLDGPWQVTFDPKRRGPGEVVFDSLQDWSKRPEEGIRYYAGTAVYRKTFDLPKGVTPDSGPLYLDLGTVKDLAEVKLNGQPLGVVWTAPWRVEISKVAKERDNTLEIAVVNQWPNRLIGDARSPSVKPFVLITPPLKQNPDQPLLPSGLLGPVTIQRVITQANLPPEERAPKPTSLKSELRVSPVQVVQSGRTVNLIPPDPGYSFETLDGKLSLKGADMTFFVSAKLGDDFKVRIRMAIEPGGKVSPAVILNGVNSVAFVGDQIALDGLNLFGRVMGKQIPWKPGAPPAVAEQRGFNLEIRRWKKAGAKTASLSIRIDDHEVVEIPDRVVAVESIALRPGHAVMRIESFTIEGDVVDGEVSASSAADAALKLKEWQRQQNALPAIDLSKDTTRHTFIAEGTTEVGHFHPHSALLSDRKTILAAWAIGHGGYAGSVARSEDGGLTWKRVDETMPAHFGNYQCGFFYQMTDPAGKERLWHIGTKTLNRLKIPGKMQGYMPRLVSEDDGKTWREENPLSPYPDQTFNVIGPFWSIVRLKDGSYLGHGHRFSQEGPLVVFQSVTDDGGFTWSKPSTVIEVAGKDPCEPFVFRSPDGTELCSLLRENQRVGTSLVIFSKDEGKTWSAPVDTPWGLTGDRHQGIQLPDGRLLFVFRDMAPGSPWRFKFVAWVGTYDDIKRGLPGQYRVKLMHSYADCGYAGLHQVSDGTVVATTYGKYWNDERKHSIISLRFKIEELDALASKETRDANAP